MAREPRSEDLFPPELHIPRGPEWTGRDLNPGPQPRKGRALPPELPARIARISAPSWRRNWLRRRVGWTAIGGDPAAGSPTATLLRLNPPYGAWVRYGHDDHISSTPHSDDVTGGVCKEQGHVHRAMMTRGYWGFHLHEGELQPSIRTKIGFRGLASPLGVAAHCPDHCSTRVAQEIWGILTYRRPLLPPSYRWRSPQSPQHPFGSAGN